MVLGLTYHVADPIGCEKEQKGSFRIAKAFANKYGRQT